MKVSIERKALLDALQVSARITPTQSSAAILKCVLIEAEPGALRLSAQDDRVSVNLTLPAEVSEPGAIAVPAKGLLDRVTTLPEDAVGLATALDTQQLEVTCRKSKFEVYGLDAELFPNSPEVGGDVSFTLPQPTLKEMIRQTVFAVSEESAQASLCGVSFILTDGNLRLVATDTHRMTLRDAALLESVGAVQKTVPTKGVVEAQRILSDREEDLVRVSLSDNQIEFKTGRATLSSRLIDLPFPRYERVLPNRDATTSRLTMGREELVAAIKRMTNEKMLAEKEAYTKVVFRNELGYLSLKTQGMDGRAEDEIECELEGEPIEFATNAERLLDALNVLNTAGVYLEMTGPMLPIIVRGVGVEGAPYLSIVMPSSV